MVLGHFPQPQEQPEQDVQVPSGQPMHFFPLFLDL
jgi:hypothetical protein